MTNRAWGWVVWPVVVVAACLAGEAAEPVMPASHLLTPLLVGFAAAISGLVAGQLPSRVTRGAHALLGVMIGASLSPVALKQVAGAAIPLLVVTAMTVVLCGSAALLLTRVGRIDRATATLGMIAGGSAAVVSYAEELEADSRLVAVMQCLRVGVVAATAPVLVGVLLASPSGPPGHSDHYSAWHLVSGPGRAGGLLWLAAVAVIAAWAGRRIRLPGATLVAPMLVAAALSLTGAATGFAPSGALRSALFTVVGLEVGLRFTRPAIARMGRILPLAVGCTVAMSAACALLAWLLSALIHVPLSDAYLATTPGGINAVLAIAVASHADVSLISSVQSLRLFVMVLLAPLLIRVLTRRPTRALNHAQRACEPARRRSGPFR